MPLDDPHRRAFLRALAPRAERAVIGASCLAFVGVACEICRDGCVRRAIAFSFAGGVARPCVDAHSCNGCGECLAACPVGAISVQA